MLFRSLFNSAIFFSDTPSSNNFASSISSSIFGSFGVKSIVFNSGVGIGIVLTKSFKGLNSARYISGTPVSGDKADLIVFILGAIPFNLDKDIF